MEPLIALIGVTVVVYVVTKVWLRRPRGLEIALRAGVGTMFVMTGLAHFVGMRAELIAMVPSWVPAPGLVISLTGVLELAAALAMLWRPLAAPAAAGLTLLLLVMFPANVELALSGQEIAWYDELLPRTVTQIVFLAATVAVAVLARRPVGAADRPAPEAVQARV